MKSANKGIEIAIVGMSCNFPGSLNIRAFWNNLKAGNEMIDHYTKEELLSAGLPVSLIDRENFVRAYSGIREKDCFDNVFFGYRLEEAALMDPQTRLFHEACWSAMEDAGCVQEIDNRKIGVFGSASDNLNWRVHSFLKRKEYAISPFYSNFISNKEYMNSLVAYSLNLRGPVFYTHTACSSSLAAVHQACHSLLLRECSIALAGGVSINTINEKGYIYEEDMIASSDGHCRAFDKRSSGTISGEGVGVVVLKRLDDAVKDNDHIYAVIKSGASNNDGNNKVGFTSPSVEGQADCIRMAHKLGSIDPKSVSYMEAHGTGTRLGDPIEIAAMNEAFNVGGQDKYCAIGSVKTNMGHLDTAAGVAGLIKSALSLENRLIPASLHFKEPNPEINFNGGPFYVNTELKKWENTEFPLRAGVSSFGIGGTNIHLVLEEAPDEIANDHSREYKILTLSAHTANSLQNAAENLKKHLEETPLVHLPDMSFTLQLGRKEFAYRKSVAYKNREDLLESLGSDQFKRQQTRAKERNDKTVFMFSGAGSQFADMGKGLYESEPVFREEMDKGFALLKMLTGEEYKKIFYPDNITDLKINEMRHTQPAIFLFAYSLARLLMSLGISPRYMIGHSIGEYVAACISGVFSFEDAIRLVVKRGELMDRMPAGGMLSVNMKAVDAKKHISDTIDIAAINSEDQVVFSGDAGVMESFRAHLENDGIHCVKLHVSQAGHSYMIEGLLGEYIQELKKIKINVPGIPFVSNVTGQFITNAEVVSVEYWARHMRETVKFSDGIKMLLSQNEDMVFVEIGGGHSLTSLLKQQAANHKFAAVNIIRHPKETESDAKYLADRLAELWRCGVKINWSLYYKNEKRKKISLPTYAFERKKFETIVNPFENQQVMPSLASVAPVPALADSVYYPVWKSAVLSIDEIDHEKKQYLFFSLGDEFSEKLKQGLLDEGNSVIEIIAGTEYEKRSSSGYVLDAFKIDQVKKCLNEIQSDKLNFSDIIYCWGMSTGSSNMRSSSRNGQTYVTYQGLVEIIREVFKKEDGLHQRLIILTNQLQKIGGNEQSLYEQALMMGVVNVLPQEYAATCFNIDLNFKEQTDELIPPLLRELKNRNSGKERSIALRYGERWVQDYQKHTYFSSSKEVIKPGGLYIITGGLGNVGFVLAKYLLEKYDAKVVTIGRKRIDQKEAGELQAERFGQLKKISENVFYFPADVAELAGFKSVISEIEEKIGTIDGVIHAAGNVNFSDFELLKNVTEEKVAAMFAPKIKGINNLYEIFKEKKPGFVWITSSLASVLGGIGFGAYSAASCYMNYFVAAKIKEIPNWKCIALSEMLFKEKEIIEERSRNRSALVPEEICQLFDWSLENNSPVIMETVLDLNERIYKTYKRGRLEYTEDSFFSEPENKMERPELSTAYVPPVTDTEKEIVNLFESFFAIKNIGTEDNFFELGGDSLKAMSLLNRIHKKLNVKIPLTEIFKSPTIGGISTYVSGALKNQYAPIEKAAEKESYSLSSPQKRLFILHNLDPESTGYNISMLLKLENDIDKEKLDIVFRKLIDRHESLRTSFEVRNDIPVQLVHEAPAFEIKKHQARPEDLNGLKAKLIKPFKLDVAPLMRVYYIDVEGSSDYLFIDMHHIITDGNSQVLLEKEFMELCSEKELPQLSFQYKDYSEWSHLPEQQQRIGVQKKYWENSLAGKLPVLQLPYDFKRPATDDSEGACVSFRLSSGNVETIRDICEKNNVTLTMVMSAALSILLSKLSGEDDLILGLSIGTRVHPDLDKIIGMFVNSLPVRVHPSRTKLFNEFLKEVKKGMLQAFENCEYQFDDLVDNLLIKREIGRNPVFDVMLNVLNQFENHSINMELKENVYVHSKETKRFDLTLNVMDTGDRIILSFQYWTKLFKPETIEKFSRYFVNIIDSLKEYEHKKIAEIEMLSSYKINNFMKGLDNYIQKDGK